MATSARRARLGTAFGRGGVAFASDARTRRDAEDHEDGPLTRRIGPARTDPADGREPRDAAFGADARAEGGQPLALRRPAPQPRRDGPHCRTTPRRPRPVLP